MKLSRTNADEQWTENPSHQWNWARKTNDEFSTLIIGCLLFTIYLYCIPNTQAQIPGILTAPVNFETDENETNE